MQTIKIFQPFSNLQSYFTDRHGGVSQKPFDSMNLAFHVDDQEADVLANRELLKKAFGKNVTLHAMEQIHGSEVCHVDSKVLKPRCDALITNMPNQLLMVMVADCIPVLFYDAKNRAVGAVHAGRAGAFGNIVKATFEKMQEAFGTQAEDLYVASGPSIRDCCYEVGEEIVVEAQILGFEDAIVQTQGRHYLNIQSIIYNQLLTLNIPPSQIEISDICTACENQTYFSYRKEGKTGRFCGGIMLK